MNFPTSVTTFQLQRNFPTSLGSFQLRLALSNFSQTFQLQTFQLQTFQLKTFQLLVLSNCPFQVHVSTIFYCPYSLYFIGEIQMSVLRALIRTPPARYYSYPVLSVLRTPKISRTPYQNPYFTSTVHFVPRTLRTPFWQKLPYPVLQSVLLGYETLCTPYFSYSVRRVREYGARTNVLV